MPLFDLYDLPYETAMKIVTKGEFATIVNFFKASTFTKMIIEKNYPLDEMEEKEKKARCFIFNQWHCIGITPISRKLTLSNSFLHLLWPTLDELRYSTIIGEWIYPLEREVFYSGNQLLPRSPPKSQEPITAEEKKMKKQQMKRQRKAQKAVKQLPAKHFSQSVKTPRGKSFPFWQ